MNAEAAQFLMRDLVGAVMNAQRLPPATAPATIAVIRHLQKLCIIPNRSERRGQTAYYTREDVLHCLFAMELHSCGIKPAQIAPIIEKYIADFLKRSATKLCLTMELGNGVRTASLTIHPHQIVAAAFDLNEERRSA